MADYIYNGFNEPPDRITQILQERAASSAPPQLPQAMALPIPQAQQVRPIDLLGQKLQAGDPQATTLLKRTQMFTGNDHNATESALQFLIDHPEDIDPSNSYQVNTALAQWSKQSGYNAQKISPQAAQQTATAPLSPQQLSMQDLASVASGKGTDFFGRGQEDQKNLANIETLSARASTGGGKLPASVILADEMQKALQSGDMQRYNALLVASKSYDKGMGADANGNPASIPGYGAALGGIEADKITATINPSGKKAESEGRGKEFGNRQGAAISDLPRTRLVASQAIAAIDKAMVSPGLKDITGIASKIPVIPGGERARAEALLDQVGGRVFLTAYDTLKGGGSITEIEGQKAEKAVAAIGRAQSYEDVLSGMQDLRQAIIDSVAAKEKIAIQTPEQIQADTFSPPAKIRQGGTLHTDASGNKAMVYPDGSYEEVP